MSEKLVLTVEETAQKLRISRNLCYRLCRQKQIPGVIFLGKRRFVSAQVIDKFIAGEFIAGEDEGN